MVSKMLCIFVEHTKMALSYILSVNIILLVPHLCSSRKSGLCGWYKMCRGHLYVPLSILTLPSVGGKSWLGLNNQNILRRIILKALSTCKVGLGGKKPLHSLIFSPSLPKSPNTMQKLRVCGAEQTWRMQCLWGIPLPWDCLAGLPNPSTAFSFIVSQCWLKICAVTALVFKYVMQKWIFIGILYI